MENLNDIKQNRYIEAFDRLLKKIPDFIDSKYGEFAHEKSRELFEQTGAVKYEGNEYLFDEDRFMFFLSYFNTDYPLENGKTAAQVFRDRRKYALDLYEQETVQWLCEAILRFCKIIKVEPDSGVTVRDVFTEEILFIRDISTSKRFPSGFMKEELIIASYTAKCGNIYRWLGVGIGVDKKFITRLKNQFMEYKCNRDINDIKAYRNFIKENSYDVVCALINSGE